MDEPVLIRDTQGKIAVLTLNRPAALNALSDQLLAALSQALADLAQDSTVRVVVLRGAGRTFCAGHDLKEMQAARAGGISPICLPGAAP
jgi:enoyl-CoA hydratase/carnithine racemase